MKTAIKHKSRRLRRFLRADEAVSALEYALLVGVIATAIAVALVTFADEIEAGLVNIGGQIDAWNVETGVDN